VAQVVERAGRGDLAKPARDEALALVHEAEPARIGDPARRALMLADATRVLATAEAPTAARRAATDAIAASDEIPDSRGRQNVASMIVRAFVESGLDDMVGQVPAETILDSRQREFEDPAERAMYLAGRVRGVADTSRRTFASERGREAVATRIKQAAEAAIAAARGLPEGETRVLVLVDVADSLAVAGETALATEGAREALAVAHRSAGPNRRGKNLAALARGLVSPALGAVARQASDEALASVPDIGDLAIKGIVRAAAANRLASLGQTEPAWRAAEASADLIGAVVEVPEGCTALLDLARAYSRLGSIWRAQMAMSRCKIYEYRITGYTSILHNYVDARRGRRAKG